jgi:hypothetical protein
MRNGYPYPYIVGSIAGTVAGPTSSSLLPLLIAAEESADPAVLDMIRTLPPLRLADIAETASRSIALSYQKACEDGSGIHADIVENDKVLLRIILSELARRAEVA